jgi:hypothetical protein
MGLWIEMRSGLADCPPPLRVSMGPGVCVVDGVVLVWFGGLRVRGLVDGVTVAM